VGGDERSGDAEDAVASVVQVLIPRVIEMCTAVVEAAIDLDHEARTGGEKINDVTTDHDLTAESDAETAAAQLTPRAEPRTP
jgi:hypothetical protein